MGKTCVGFVVGDTFEIINKVLQRNIKDKFYIDNVGKSFIVYYPSISYETTGKKK